MTRNGRILTILLLTLFATPAFAWTRQGHRMVAIIASHRLTPEATAQVRQLLDGQAMADVALWPDEIRPDHPETAPWHYVAIPGSAAGYDRQRDCPIIQNRAAVVAGTNWRDCAPDMILFFEAQLADASVPREQKIAALKWLIHLVGDLHTPFHADGDGKSGNAIHVKQFGSNRCKGVRCNLHLTWDEGLIQHRGLDETAYVQALEDEIAAKHPVAGAAGTPAEWADESHRLALAAALADGGIVDQAYYDREISVVDLRLEQAGLRLAAALNMIFTAFPR